MSIMVGADHNLTYQLSYSSQYTLLSRLMRKFHQELTSDDARRVLLEQIFRNIIQQFQTVEPFSDFQALLSSTTQLLGQNLAYALDIDFSAYDPSNFFRSLRVHPKLLGEVRSFDELGTGQRQVLAIAFAYAYAKAFGRSEGLILIVDEPESNLHPLAQRWLAKQLGSLSTDGLQVVVTTHSPHFVELSNQQNVALVKKDRADAHTIVVQHDRASFVDELISRGAPDDRTNDASVGEFYGAAATTEVVSGLFARVCVVVEGRTEEFALPELLRLVGLEPLSEGIAFVSAEGITNIAKWVRLYAAYKIPVFAIFDTDSDKSGKEAQTSKTAQIDIGAAMSLAEGEMFPLSLDPIAVEPNYATLSPNFEGAAAELLGTAWSDLESEGRDVVGGSKAGKPLVARYSARRLKRESIPADAIAQLSRLADEIRALVPDVAVSSDGSSD